jgi:FAD/FMN-containing dehydrogenase
MANKTAVRDIHPNEIESFKKSLSNESTTLMSNDEGYEEALIRWAINAQLKAGLIVNVFTLDDVVATVNFARKHGCDFTVHGGGHSPSGHSSSNGGIVLDMRKRNKVQVDVEKKLVHVQAGAVWSEVNNAAWEHGLAVVGGTVESVGVGGLTLAGGFGFLTGKYYMKVYILIYVYLRCYKI